MKRRQTKEMERCEAALTTADAEAREACTLAETEALDDLMAQVPGLFEVNAANRGMDLIGAYATKLMCDLMQAVAANHARQMEEQTHADVVLMVDGEISGKAWKKAYHELLVVDTSHNAYAYGRKSAS